MHILPEAIVIHSKIPTVIIMSLITWILLGLFFLILNKKIFPSKIQSFIEIFFEFINNLASNIIGHTYKNFLPLFYGVFFYIFLGNLIGLIPGFSSPTATLNTTLSLAVVVFIYYNYIGIKLHGLNYLKHFMGPKLPFYLLPLNILILIIELIGHIARPISLSIRLFGNIFAKEVLLGILGFLIIIFFAIPNPFIKFSLSIAPVILRPLIILLGVVVSFVQAVVFLLLSMIYIAGAVSEE